MEYKSYPVKVEALRVEWILYNQDDTDFGQEFLHAIYKSENIELYDITTIKILIEFLFREYRTAILWWEFPFYLFRLFLFILLVYLDERKFTLIHINDGEENKFALHLKPDYNHTLTFLVVFLNLFLIIHGYYMVYSKFMTIKCTYFFELWGMIDNILSILQILICMMILVHYNEPDPADPPISSMRLVMTPANEVFMVLHLEDRTHEINIF